MLAAGQTKSLAVSNFSPEQLLVPPCSGICFSLSYNKETLYYLPVDPCYGNLNEFPSHITNLNEIPYPIMGS